MFVLDGRVLLNLYDSTAQLEAPNVHFFDWFGDDIGAGKSRVIYALQTLATTW